MIPLLILTAFYLLLWTPWLGKVLGHSVLHLLLHLAHGHDDTLLNVLAVCCWLVVPLWVLFALTGYWWGVADVFVGVLIATKLFHTFSSH